jgi:hypothetical protein
LAKIRAEREAEKRKAEAEVSFKPTITLLHLTSTP